MVDIGAATLLNHMANSITKLIPHDYFEISNDIALNFFWGCTDLLLKNMF